MSVHINNIMEKDIYHVYFVLLYLLLLKENAQFVILYNPKKSSASWVYIMFLQNSKITNYKHTSVAGSEQLLSYFNISENLQ